MDAEFIASAIPVSTGQEPADRLAHLFDAHYSRLCRLARRISASRDDALDLVQETFLRAARTRKPIPSGAMDEEAWLVRVLINIQRDAWRRKSVRERHERVSRQGEGGNTEGALIARAAVWQALNLLPPRRRAIVVMHELEGLDSKAIAALLDISGATVRWHLSRGRQTLSKALRAQAGESK